MPSRRKLTERRKMSVEVELSGQCVGEASFVEISLQILKKVLLVLSFFWTDKLEDAPLTSEEAPEP